MKRFLFLLIPFFLFRFLAFSQAETVTVNFAFNKAALNEKSISLLTDFINTYKDSSNNIFLYGHTDSKGSTAYNIALSINRIEVVEDFLVKNNFKKNRISSIPFGESKLLLIDDADEIKGEINRRVQIIVTENDIAIKKEKTLKEIIEDTATKKGATLVLKNMEFVGGRHTILPSSLPQLNDLLFALKQSPSLKISIEGHVCCLPGVKDGEDFDTNTQNLSYNRSKAIFEFLINAGINAKRMSYKGFGNSNPIYPYPEKNEEERTRNRRVEIRIVDK